MCFKKIMYAFLVIMCFAVVSQATLIHHRDTLHILSAYGREVSFSANPGNKFIIDSVTTINRPFPCSLSIPGIFFAWLGDLPTCPCCPRWALGSSRPFYSPISAIDWSAPLHLTDSLHFRKIDTSRSDGYCYFPMATPNMNGDIFIFSTTSILNRTIYLLVHVYAFFLDQREPTQTSGGSLGYPIETCKNMLAVDLNLQTDGSTDFSGASITPIQFTKHYAVAEPHKAEISSSFQLFNLQGRLASFTQAGACKYIPHGCYLKKSGTRLSKWVLINP